MILKIFNKIIRLMQIFFLKFINYFLLVIDRFIIKKNNYWIFPVYFVGKGHFSDNMLAIYENVKNDPSIKKIVLTKDVDIELTGENIEILPMTSLKAVYYMMKSNILFVQHSIWLDFSQAVFQINYPLERKIINLWHGIPLKDISHQNTGIYNKRATREMLNYNIIVSSNTDLNNMKKAFNITPENQFWITGLPRNDFLLMSEIELPIHFQDELKYIQSILKNRDLILYAPTYREINVGGENYNFSKNELKQLELFLIEHNIVFGIRYHPYLKPKDYQNLLNLKNVIDLSSDIISDVRMLLRTSSVIVTDYSSLFIDALYINKKCISFAYDFEHYKKTQRGFFYDFEIIFPGEICKNFNDLIFCLHQYKESFSDTELKKIEQSKKMFFKQIDLSNSKRVVSKVKALINK